MDYKELLRKYLEYVWKEEGTDLLGVWASDVFTPEELKELQRLSTKGKE